MNEEKKIEDIDKKIENVERSINRIVDKKSNIYLLIQDTKGNVKGSVAYMYELCRLLNEKGYNSFILHDDDYKGVETWMGLEYSKLPHMSIKSNLSISAADIIIIPEVMSYVMEQLANIPAIKIILCQAYDYIFETLPPGSSWLDFGFDKCIIVSDSYKEYIESFFQNVKIDVVNPFINDYFIHNELPVKPVIAVHSREQRDSLKIIKSFYTKYPQFRWITFRDMRSLSKREFASTLQECCLSVWIDDIASFGTFPLESMSCGIPVIGKVPNMVPEWMNDENGIWISEYNEIIDYISKYIQYWLEDKIPPELYDNMNKTIKSYSEEKTSNQIQKIIDFYFEKRVEALSQALNKLKEKEVTE